MALVWTLTLSARPSEMETRYDALAERFTVRDKALQNDLAAYLRAYPYTTYTDEVHFMQGVLLTEQGEYAQSLSVFETVKPKALTRPHQTDYIFYRGYAYFMTQDYAKAADSFAQLSKSKNAYTTRSTYYYAYCMYKQQQYAAVLPAFLKLENTPEYRETVPYYIVQIYFAQGYNDEVKQRAQTLLAEQPDNTNNAELHRLLGELAFRDGDYATAAEHLRAYYEASEQQAFEPVRNDLFMLGMATYRLKDYKAAARYLKLVKQQPDTLAEATCLTMGHVYVRLNQLEQAKLSYQAAMNYALTPSVTEEAAYNYTLCAYRSSTALGESVHAFNDFLQRYPDSKHASHIYQLMSDVFMQSKNYAAALSSLETIAQPSATMRETKQYLRYQLGADCFLQGKMQEAIDWMSAVIDHRSESAKYTTEAYYIRAEANYRLHLYDACEKDLQSFFACPDVAESDNRSMAYYLQGYCAFVQGHYAQAREAFSIFIDVAMTTDPTYADALNRIGDCYFNGRQFKEAITYYAQVSDLQASGADYALFQRGYALGLLHNYVEKEDVLRQLVSRYPKSDYADDGVYETARAQLHRDDEQGAILTYEQLLNDYPQSPLTRKASLERAMLFRNLHRVKEAIGAYRVTIERFPATEEAYAALDALQALYVEQGNVDEYIAYTKDLARMNMNVTTQEDSLIYVAAELQYMQAAYKKAAASFTNYINRYCAGGRYCAPARYYLADSYYRLGSKSEALEQYRILADISANPYQEEAAIRVAEIYYDKAQYDAAYDAFYHMFTLASTRENAHTAQLGMLRCSRLLYRYQNTIDIATQILGNQPVSDEMRNEALDARAHAFIALEHWEQAQPDLRELAHEVRTAQGAEAKYLLAQSYYELDNIDQSEAEVMSFTRMNTQQQYWLARALILLSDINRRRGDYFQSRQYLLALKRNYTLNGDDIPAIISERLATLDKLELSANEKEE